MAALIILLLVLGALAAGVLVGRYYVPDDRGLKRRARHGQAYLRALTHHIARDPATVIAELRAVVDDNVADSEPYFALAALFRSGGDHERAIRVHQALAVREGATGRLRQQALYELGLDFRAAGMPRRAVKAMEQVLGDDSGHEGALRALCGLYEEQGRFAEAAGAWARLAKVRGEPVPRRHHHLLCAAAQQAIAAGDLDSAKLLLREAKGAAASPHFFAIAAELAAARGNPHGARERLVQALTAAPALAPYLVPGLVAAERALADATPARAALAAAGEDVDPDATPPLAPPEAPTVAGLAAAGQPTVADAVAPTRPPLVATLLDLAEATGSAAVRVAAARQLAPADGPAVDRAAAAQLLAAVDASAPAFVPARLLAARAALADGDPAAIQAALAALVEALAWADGSSWRCTHCGHRSEQFGWRCAGCRRWACAAPELGRERVEVVAAAPRERRGERRPSALLGERADGSLPGQAVEHGLTGVEVAARAQRRSLLGRVGGWISGAWSGVRRGDRS
ncbi:MAG: tetratricopeptide repeat protein [Kofleriaceae bacterium]